LAYDSQPRAAIPHFTDETLYLDAEVAHYDIPYLRKVIHHEFFHFFAYSIEGVIYEDKSGWTLLNPKDFKYGTGGVNMQSDGRVTLPKLMPGFINEYSTSGQEEDKAEMFAYMVHDYNYIFARSLDDVVLGQKNEIDETNCERLL